MEQDQKITNANESGFSLIEIIISIVLVGIAVPTFINYFGGLKDSQQPEVLTQGVFLATRQLEGIGNEPLSRMPAAGTYDCAAFQASPVGADFNIDCTSPVYQFSWEVDDVAAGNPNAASGGATFGKKVTLTVSAPGMPSIQLFSLF